MLGKRARVNVIPLRQAIAWILLSVVVVLLIVVLCRYAYGTLLTRRATDPAYRLFAIVQTGPEKEALKTGYLSELLRLSVDQPVNLYAFDCAAARRHLLASPLIKSASVKTYLPGTVYVDYLARKPLVYLRDYTNTAVDDEGILIPCQPFFTPKRIPAIYLGLPFQEQIWGRSIQGAKLALALAIKDLVEALLAGSTTSLQLIDVSLAEATSLGQREIVLTLEEGLEGVSQPVIVRLDPSHYPEALAHYLTLRTHFRSLAGKIIDLRLPQLAYVRDFAQKDSASADAS